MKITHKIIIQKFVLSIVLILFTPYVYAASSGDVVINELMWMGSSASTSDEWIELRNMTDEDINLSGWDITRLSDGEEKLMLTMPSGKTLPASGYFLIARYAANDSRSKLNIEPDITSSNVSLANTKLQIKIYNGGVLIDTADDGSGNPLAGDNVNKCSMERRDPPGDGTVSSNWQTASASVNWDIGATEKGTPTNSLDPSLPSAIFDLVASLGDNDGEIVLTWTSPTEDTSGGGKVSFYELKYASFSFTNDDWDLPDVINASNEPDPKFPGEEETMVISNLKPAIIYYFAIKSGDDEGKISDIDTKTKNGNQTFCIAKGDIKIKITEVSFASSNDWVELYNWGEENINISNFMLTDLDGVDSVLAQEDVTLKSNQYAVIHWDDTGIDETDKTGDLNGNGYIDLYLSDTGLSSTDDEVVLVSAAINGDYIDAVCWSNLDGTYNNTDLRSLIDKSMWVTEDSFTENDCWTSSKNVDAYSSIGRKPPLYEDTNSKGDWYLYSTPTPGQENLFLQIIKPEDGSIIEQSQNTQIILDISFGEAKSIDFMYRKKGARNWNYIAQGVTSPFNINWDTTFLDMGSYELQLLADSSVYSSPILVTLIKSESPETIITQYPQVLINNKNVIFSFSGQDNITSPEELIFIYKLDDNDWQELGCVGQISLENLADGKHTFTVKTRDEAGCEDMTPADYTFTIDTTAPEVFIKMPYEGDRIAGNAVPIKAEFIDTDIDMVIFQYRLPDEEWQDIQAIRESPFIISWDVSNLANKVCYQLRLKAVDKAGNINDNLSAISITVDFDEPNYGGNKVFIDPQQGGTITTFDGTKINIPAGGIRGSELVEMDIVRLKPEILNQSQHSYIKTTGIAKEFLLNNDQYLLEQGKFAEITFYYSEYEIAGIKEDTLRLFYWDDKLQDWQLINNSHVYPEENCVKAEIDRFTIYQIMGYAPDSELNSIYVFPNPCYCSVDKRVNFSKLPDSIEEIFIYNLSGELIKKLPIDLSNLNDMYWSCDNESGDIVASGIYFCLVKTDSEQKIIKIAVIK